MACERSAGLPPPPAGTPKSKLGELSIEEPRELEARRAKSNLSGIDDERRYPPPPPPPNSDDVVESIDESRDMVPTENMGVKADGEQELAEGEGDGLNGEGDVEQAEAGVEVR